MRTALFWVIAQRVVVIYYRRFGTAYPSYLKESRIHSTLRKVPERRSYYTPRGAIMKSFILPADCFVTISVRSDAY